MTLRQSVVDAARKYESVKFYHAGRNVNGLDCVGLLVVAAMDAGISVPDDRSYSPVINAQYMMFRLGEMCRLRRSNEQTQIGDVFAFKIGKSIQHVGLVTCLEPMTFIHSHQGAGRVVEHLLDQKWQSCLAGVYTLNAYEDN